jgi:hypothetical protein
VQNHVPEGALVAFFIHIPIKLTVFFFFQLSSYSKANFGAEVRLFSQILPLVLNKKKQVLSSSHSMKATNHSLSQESAEKSDTAEDSWKQHVRRMSYGFVWF